MLNGGGPQAGQHGDSRAVAGTGWGGLSPSRGPAGAPGAHAKSVRGPEPVKRQMATLSVAVSPPLTLPLIVANSSEAPSAKMPSVASVMRDWLITLGS